MNLEEQMKINAEKKKKQREKELEQAQRLADATKRGSKYDNKR